VSGNGARSAASATVRRTLQRGVKSLAVAADRVRRPRPGVVVLAYHRVGARTAATEIDLPRAVFAEQMEEIAARATTLDEALSDLADAPATPGRDVVVTFDDGTVDFVEEALPELVRYQVPALLYVATEHIDEGRAFPSGGEPLSWNAIRDAVATGLVTIGSHTHSHALLDRSPAPVAADELDRSIELIGAHIGVAPSHFAYPKALAGNTSVSAEVACRFRSAAIAGTRPNRYGATDPYRLARSPIQTSDEMRWFRRKVDGGMAVEDDLRRAANRVRYAGATS
jgi:peptidoglycan/xylan/chitin deacetylase (PgdA/CDA1 family)